MSEADAQVTARASIPRLGEPGRVVPRGLRSAAEAASLTPSFAESLANASQLVDGDELGASTGDGDGEGSGDGELTRGSRKTDDTSSLESGTEVRPSRSRTGSSVLATTDPNLAGVAAVQASTTVRT